jgi:hypothetical protein
MNPKTELAAHLMHFYDDIGEWRNLLNKMAKSNQFLLSTKINRTDGLNKKPAIKGFEK